MSPARRDAKGRFVKGSGSGGSKRSKVIDKDMGYANFLKLVMNADKLVVAVGPMGPPAEYGLYNEFGVPSKSIPSRPFMRSTVDSPKNQRIIAQTFRDGFMRLAIRNISNPVTAFDLAGIKLQEMLKIAIVKWKEPPNAPSTIRAKGSGVSNPLTDTGALSQSVQHDVRAR